MEAIFRDYPKFVGMTEDMHNLASYINDLRIMTFVITVTGYIIGICFLMLKCCQWRKKAQKRRRRREGVLETADFDFETTATYQPPQQYTSMPIVPLTTANRNIKANGGYHRPPMVEIINGSDPNLRDVDSNTSVTLVNERQ